MLTLFHSHQSRSSSALWLLEELGMDYELKHVEVKRRDGSGNFDEHNPHPDKKVPAIDHDGQIITEQAAIYLYLSDLVPDAKMGPQVGEPKRGEFLTWLAYYAGVVEPVITLKFLEIEHPGLVRAFREVEDFHRRINQALDQGDYIMGDQFTAVDILFASMGNLFRQALPAGEKVDNYIARCIQRPALQRAMAKDSPS